MPRHLRNTASRSRRALLRLEPLEDRFLLSATLAAVAPAALSAPATASALQRQPSDSGQGDTSDPTPESTGTDAPNQTASAPVTAYSGQPTSSQQVDRNGDGTDPAASSTNASTQNASGASMLSTGASADGKGARPTQYALASTPNKGGEGSTTSRDRETATYYLTPASAEYFPTGVNLLVAAYISPTPLTQTSAGDLLTSHPTSTLASGTASSGAQPKAGTPPPVVPAQEGRPGRGLAPAGLAADDSAANLPAGGAMDLAELLRFVQPAQTAVRLVETAGESAELPPQRPFLLSPSGVLPLDVRGWEQEVRQFLGQLDSLIAESEGRALWSRLGPWSVAVMASVVALELYRRKGARRPPGPDGFLWINHGC
jgi:hypothetical protein